MTSHCHLDADRHACLVPLLVPGGYRVCFEPPEPLHTRLTSALPCPPCVMVVRHQKTRSAPVARPRSPLQFYSWFMRCLDCPVFLGLVGGVHPVPAPLSCGALCEVLCLRVSLWPASRTGKRSSSEIPNVSCRHQNRLVESRDRCFCHYRGGP